MAASDKNIVISPQRGSATLSPTIAFTGDGNDPITLYAPDGVVGSLSFEGSAGQLFSITNNLTSGSIFSVNDVSGIPSLDIDASGLVQIAPLGGIVALGQTTVTAGNVLDVKGNVRIDGNLSITGTTLITNLNADLLDGQDGSYYRNASNINAGTIGDAYLPATISSNITGNAATATKLATARTISITGDGSGSASFDGSANVSISLTISDDSHNHIISNIDGLQSALDAKAPLASPALTGTPTAPTAAAGTNTTQIATTAFVGTAVANLVDAAPTTLDTLNELAAALGDDPNFATTVTNSLATKLSTTTTFGGDVSGTYNAIVVANDSHSHSEITTKGSYIWNASSTPRSFPLGVSISFVQSTQGWQNYGSVLSMSGYSAGQDGGVAQFYFPYSSTYGGNSMQYRLGLYNNAGWTGWKIPWDNTNDGSGSGLDADTLDGIQASSFLRSDADDTATGALTLSKNNYQLAFDRPDGAGQDWRFYEWASGLNIYPSTAASDVFFGRDGYTTYVDLWNGGLKVAGTLVLNNGRQLSNVTYGGNTIWHAGNDGSGSGLDADTLDGINSGSFLRSDANDTATGVITLSGAASDRLNIYNTTNGGEVGIRFSDATGQGQNGYFRFRHQDSTSPGSAYGANFEFSTDQPELAVIIDGSGDYFVGTSKVWNAGNDGGGSGLDADLLDGQQGSYYLNTSTTFGGDVSGTYNAIVVADDSHNHAFDNLTGKTSGTGDYATTGSIVSGKGSGGVALTTNDGKGNANVTFNHQDGVPEQNGNAARIEVNTDSTTNAAIYFEGKSDVTGGVNVNLNDWFTMSDSGATCLGNTVWHAGNDGSGSGLDADTLDGINSGSFLRSDVDDTFTGTQIQIGSGSNTYLSSNSLIINNTEVSANSIYIDSNQAWHAGNDGSGSGLDADLLDGIQASSFLRSDAADISTGGTLEIRDGTAANEAQIKLDTTQAGSPQIGFGDERDNTGDNYWAIGADDTDVSYFKFVTRNTTGIPIVNANTSSQVKFTIEYDGNLWAGPQDVNKIWHAGNDGTGSGLDADLLDGQQGSYYLDYNNFTNTPSIPGVGDGTLTVQGSNGLTGSGTFTANQSTNTTITVSHADTSSQASVDNSNGTVIQDVTLDGYGHVTGLASVNLDGRYYTETESDARFLGISAKAADSELLDGIDSGSFLRSDANDSFSGNLTGSGTILTTGTYIGITGDGGGVAMTTNDGYGNANLTFNHRSGIPDKSGNALRIETNVDNTANAIIIFEGKSNVTSGVAVTLTELFTMSESGATCLGNTVWHAGNDGSGSGLDADTLDGISSGSFLRSDADDNASGKITFNGAISAGSAAKLQINGFQRTGPIMLAVGTAGTTSFNATSERWLMNDGSHLYASTSSSGYNNKIWTDSNDGSGSGLDADTVDGIQASSFLRSDADGSFSGTITGTKGSSGPSLIIDGNGPNIIRFLDQGSSNLGIDLVFRTTPNTLGFEKSTDGTNLWETDCDTGVTNFDYNPTVSGNTIWHAGNDGSGSGLDADTLDGVQASSFYQSGQLLSMAADINLNGQTLNIGGTNTSTLRWSGVDTHLNLISGNYLIRDNTTTRFTFQRTTGNLLVTGNVGIGTSTPTAKLHVEGTLKVPNLDFDYTNNGSVSGLDNTRFITGFKHPDGDSISNTTNTAGIVFLEGDIGIEAVSGTQYSGSFSIYTKNSTYDYCDNYINASPNQGISFGASGGYNFYTTQTAGNGAPSVALTLSNTGNVGIGTTNPSQKLHVNGTALSTRIFTAGTPTNDPGRDITIWGSGTRGIYIRNTSSNVGYSLIQDSVGDFKIKRTYSSTSESEGLTLDTSGNLIVNSGAFFAGGATSSPYGNKVAIHAAQTHSCLELKNLGVDGNSRAMITFYDGGGADCGRITINAVNHTTAYNTSSDYRLKENIEPISDAILRIKQLKPCRFNFISNSTKEKLDGFIAHEAQQVVPECVTGTKDEVDENGNPIYQGIDQSKLVPLLTAALQEALQKISNLEERLNAAGM